MADEDEAYDAERRHKAGLPAQAGLPPAFETPEEAARKEELRRATLDGEEATRKWANDKWAQDSEHVYPAYRRWAAEWDSIGAHVRAHEGHVHIHADPGSLAQVKHVQREAYELACAKNVAYGASWRRRGYMGNVARILSKMDRIEAMMWQDDQDTDHEGQQETIDDTLLDLINLAAFTIVNMREGNRWGKP